MLTESLKEINSIYDMMALCGRYILKVNQETPCDFSEFDDELYNNVYDAIVAYCYTRANKGTRNAFLELRNFAIDFLKRGDDPEKCYAIVKYIDELVEVEFTAPLLEYSTIIAYSHMNTRYCDEICIVPKMRNNVLAKKAAQMGHSNNAQYGLFRRTREYAGSILDKSMVNYIIWDKEHIRKYPFTIYRCGEEHAVTEHFQSVDRLTFGIIPLVDEELDKIFDVRYNKKTFEIESMKYAMEQKLIERYKDVYKKCLEKNIDFLIFPELLMTEKIMGALERDGYGSPWLVINGSVWKELVNRTYVTDGKGEILFNYCKKEPFVYKDTYTEHLDNSKNLEYAILELENFGRISIAICKDLVNEDVKAFHKHMGTNILLVPAYTQSMDLCSGAGELSRDYNCIVVVANSCSALRMRNESSDGPERIGFMSLPAKNGTDRDELIHMYFKNQCMEKCQQCCTGKVISIDLQRKNDSGSSYWIEESEF